MSPLLEVQVREDVWRTLQMGGSSISFSIMLELYLSISYVFFSWSSWHWADFIGRPYLVAYLVMSSLWDPSKDGKNREIVREPRVFKGRSVRCSRQIFLWNLCWGASSSTCWQRCVGHQRPKVGLLEGQFREPKAFIQYTQYIPYTMLQLL